MFIPFHLTPIGEIYVDVIGTDQNVAVSDRDLPSDTKGCRGLASEIGLYCPNIGSNTRGKE